MRQAWKPAIMLDCRLDMLDMNPSIAVAWSCSVQLQDEGCTNDIIEIDHGSADSRLRADWAREPNTKQSPPDGHNVVPSGVSSTMTATTTTTSTMTSPTAAPNARTTTSRNGLAFTPSPNFLDKQSRLQQLQAEEVSANVMVWFFARLHVAWW